MDRFEDVLIRCGAISSLIGVAILVTLAIVLLVYPVSKYCENNTNNCEFISDSPDPIKGIVQPITLITSLAGIAAGIVLLRLGMWRKTKKIT
jgi:hypothetical protein